MTDPGAPPGERRDPERDERGPTSEVLLRRDLRGFFVEPAWFERLRSQVLPRVLAQHTDAEPLRIWVPGCETGERAYSIAIELLELSTAPFRIFATDADARSVDEARVGVYRERALAKVGAERRARYFTPHGDGERVTDAVRQTCVFAQHELSRNPPLGRMDLVVCAEVLPRLRAGRRKRALLSLHYALREGGMLLLADDESAQGDEFEQVDGPLHVRRAVPGAPRVHESKLELVVEGAPQSPQLALDLARRFDRALLQHYAPPSLLVSEAMTVLQSRGELSAVFGQACHGDTLRALAGVALGSELERLTRTALAEARTLRESHEHGDLQVDVTATPLLDAFDRVPTVMLAFELRQAVQQAPLHVAGREFAELRDHLADVALAHAHATEELDFVNRELADANTTLSARNEELQHLNAELRGAQKELLRGNLDLSELNTRLSERNRELTQLHGDLVNVFNTADMAVVILDARLRIRRFTQQARQLAFMREEDLGRPFEDLRLTLDVPDLSQRLADAIAHGASSEREVRDEQGHWHRLAIKPYRAPDQRVDGVLISLTDVDTLKLAVDRAERASQEAERASRTKDEFLATLSHELRSPLHGVLVYAQLLRRGALRGETLQQATEAIESGITQLVQLIDELLDVSRIVSGKFSLLQAPVDLVGVVARSLDAVASKCARKQLCVSTELPGSLYVLGDALRLQQVIGNLLSNALKFTHEGGSIAIRLISDGEHARLSVRDDGAGIDPAFLPRVFDRFTQGDSALTREFGGLGLGLHIVRHIVELHGGEVGAVSDGLGHGAELRVVLPLCEAVPAAAAAPLRPIAPRALEGVRVLVVDDDHVARHALADTLAHAGAEVIDAPSAADALEALREFAPRLMVCDIAMPGEDGYALIGRVRALPDAELARTPALALTAFARASDRKRALDCGYQEHLAKPVDVDALLRALITLDSSER